MAKTSIVLHDPALNDFLVEHWIAREILKILTQLGSRKPEGWVKVSDIIDELTRIKEQSKLGGRSRLRTRVHYYCKRLYEKYEAIDRHAKNRPLFYRIIDKGKVHLTKIQSEKGKGEDL